MAWTLVDTDFTGGNRANRRARERKRRSDKRVQKHSNPDTEERAGKFGQKRDGK